MKRKRFFLRANASRREAQAQQEEEHSKTNKEEGVEVSINSRNRNTEKAGDQRQHDNEESPRHKRFKEGFKAEYAKPRDRNCQKEKGKIQAESLFAYLEGGNSKREEGLFETDSLLALSDLVDGFSAPGTDSIFMRNSKSSFENEEPSLITWNDMVININTYMSEIYPINVKTLSNQCGITIEIKRHRKAMMLRDEYSHLINQFFSWKVPPKESFSRWLFERAASQNSSSHNTHGWKVACQHGWQTT